MNLKSNSKQMTCKYPNHHSMIELLAFFIQHIKECVCASYAKVCKLGQSVKTQSFDVSKSKKHDYPHNLCTQWSPQKHLRDILS